MDIKTSKITAQPVSEASGQDSSLPDPTGAARAFLFGCIVVAFALAVVLNWQGWDTKPFKPAEGGTANFALFAGFYVGAQVIERLMELISPVLPLWGLPAGFSTDAKVRVAQVKADRAKATMGLATLAGVGISAGFGLYFLDAVGMHVSGTVDIFSTGLIIAAGTKPLHDLISNLQNKNTPSTGTGTTA